MKCMEMMTPEPACCVPADSAARVAALMRSANVGSIPVCLDDSSKRLIGIVTDRDLALKVVAEGKDPNGIQAADVMSPQPVACREDDDARSAIEAMERHQVRRIPVVDGTGRLRGIIAQADVAIRYGHFERTAQVIHKVSAPFSREV